MYANKEVYTIRGAREKITDIISKTKFGSIDRKDAIPYLTGQTNKVPIATWGFDDNWVQWGNPEFDEDERCLGLENGYLLGMTEEERRKRIDVEYLRREEEANISLAWHIAEYEEIKDIGRNEAAKAFAKLNLKPIEDKLERAAETAETNGAKLDALADWLTDWRKHAPAIDAENPPKTSMTKNVRDAIVKAWTDYQANPDNYTKDVIDRKPGEKPNLEECLKYRGDDIVYREQTLRQLLTDAKKPNEGIVRTFKRLCDAARKADNRRNNTD